MRQGVTRVKVNVRKKQGQGNALADEAGDLQDRLRMELGSKSGCWGRTERSL
jgi:hypothetical protein